MCSPTCQRFKPVRQFVLSVPKRLRPYLHHRPKTATAVLHILLRALLATLKEASPTAPATDSMGVVSFLHRFGSSLNPHFIELSFASFDGLAEALFGALRALPHGPLGSTFTWPSSMDSSRESMLTGTTNPLLQASTSTKLPISPPSSWRASSIRYANESSPWPPRTPRSRGYARLGSRWWF